jgi:hypothetical protein
VDASNPADGNTAASGGGGGSNLVPSGGTSRLSSSAAKVVVSWALPDVTVSNNPTSGGTFSGGGDDTFTPTSETANVSISDLVVRARYSCADALHGPGIWSCTGTVKSGSKLATAKPGRHTLRITAMSADGQRTTRTVSYRVVLPSNRFTVSHIRTDADGDVSFDVAVPGPGVVNVLETAWDSNEARAATLLLPAPRRFVYARAHRVAGTRGTLLFTVSPNARGLRLIAHHTYQVTLRLWVTYQPPDGHQRQVGFYDLHLGPGGAP